jgi:hypothetical protein
MLAGNILSRDGKENKASGATSVTVSGAIQAQFVKPAFQEQDSFEEGTILAKICACNLFLNIEILYGDKVNK